MARLVYLNDEIDNVVTKELNDLSERINESILVMHPSAYLFSNNFKEKNKQYFNHLLKLNDWEPLWPHNLILLSQIENIKYLQIFMPSSANPIDKSYYMSLKSNNSSYRPLFAGKDPDVLIKEFTLHLNIIDNLTLAKDFKNLILTKLTKAFLKKATILRRYALMDPLLCNYYGVETRKLGVIILLKDGMSFMISVDRLLKGKYRLIYSELIIKTLYSFIFNFSNKYKNKIENLYNELYSKFSR
jgi:hypothetical protein